MNKRMITKNSLLIVILLAMALALIAISVVGAHFPVVQQNNDGNDGAVIARALKHGGLREAAKLKGHYIADFDPHWDFGQFDIEMLTKDSVAVIVGVMNKKLDSRLTTNGQVILTDYAVTVQEALKGELKAGDPVTVSLPGGHVDFEDGTSAELRTPKFEHMKEGGTYTLFLSKNETDQSLYTLTAGPQGLVEIIDNNRVKSHGRETDPINQQSKDKDRDTFLKEVRKQAERWPNPGKCCH